MTPDERPHQSADHSDGQPAVESVVEPPVQPGVEPNRDHGLHQMGANEVATASRDSEQSQLDLGVISTGAANVDQALRGLENIAERPVDEHAEIYEAVLGGLTAAMDDSGPSGS
jgi:hypothetical protein